VAVLLRGRERRRQSCFKIELFPGDGVQEPQKLGMQEISTIARQAREVFQGQSGWAVQRITQQGMTDGCQMDPDLMGTSRGQAYLERGGARRTREYCCQ
jgi:hypothetical protein